MQRITHIGVISLGNIMGLVTLVLGSIFAIVYGMVLLIMLAAGMGGGGLQPGPLEIGMVLGMLVVVPIAYGIFGFIMGAIYAVVLNLVFYMVGGLEVKIEAE